MAATDTISALRTFFVEELLEGQGEGLDSTTPLIELGLLNSMSIMMLVSFVKRELGITLRPQDLTPDNLRTLEVLAKLVDSRAS